MKTIQEQLEIMFAPDLRVKLDKYSTIIGVESLTIIGAKFLICHNILELDYDQALSMASPYGLCFEVLDEQED